MWSRILKAYALHKLLDWTFSNVDDRLIYDLKNNCRV